MAGSGVQPGKIPHSIGLDGPGLGFLGAGMVC